MRRVSIFFYLLGILIPSGCIVKGKEGEFTFKVRIVIPQEDLEKLKRSNISLNVVVLERDFSATQENKNEILEQMKSGEEGGEKFMESLTFSLIDLGKAKKCEKTYVWENEGEIKCESIKLIEQIAKYDDLEKTKDGLYYRDISMKSDREKKYTIQIYAEDGGKFIKAFSRNFYYVPQMTAWLKIEVKPEAFYPDLDNDGFPSDTTIYRINELPGYITATTSTIFDCDDTDPNINPGAQEICEDGKDNNCDGIDNKFLFEDKDKDGYAGSITPVCDTSDTNENLKPLNLILGFGDCDDNDPNINPGALPNCTNSKDNNCDGNIESFAYIDADGDNYSPNSVSYCLDIITKGYVEAMKTLGTNDCDDSNPSAHPGNIEICDGIDNNCNGQVDEGVKLTFYKDQDGDGFGSPSQTTQACNQITGYVSNSLDCDDSNPAVNPNAIEVINGIDDNCNGQIDEGGGMPTFYRDQDGDGFGNPSAATQAASQPPGYVSNPLDCDDSNPSINPNTVWYKDYDGDSYSDSTTQTQCQRPAGYKLASELLSTSGDCDDTNQLINPNTRWFKDNDNDGFYPSAGSSISCINPFFPQNATYIPIKPGDCDDSDPLVYPNAPLNCNNSKDNDCSGQVESWFFQDQDSDSWTTSVSQCANSMPSGFTSVSNPLDCDDLNANINPGTTDNSCDAIDNNCNLYVDENTSPCYSPSLTIYTWGISYATLKWSYPTPSSNVEIFVIEKSTDGSKFYQVALTSLTYYTDYSYNSMDKYYRVYAKNTTGNGPLSNTVSLKGFSVFAKAISGPSDEVGYSLVQVPLSLKTNRYLDGGYLLAGTTTSYGAGDEDIIIVKTSPNGATSYVKVVGGTKRDRAYYITPSQETALPSISFIIVGETYSFGGTCGGNCSDMLFMKIGPDGSISAQKYIGGVTGSEIAYSAIQDISGTNLNYVVVGETYSYGNTCGGNCSDIMIVNLNSTLAISRAVVIGGGGNDTAKSIIETQDGNYLIVGKTNSFGSGGYDIFVAKITRTTLDVLWAETIGTANDDAAESAIRTEDGGFIIVGTTHNGTNNDVFVLKITSAGGIQWATKIDTNGEDSAKAISITRDGKYIIVGETSSSSTKDTLLIKIDGSGNVEWTKTIGKNTGDEIVNSVITDEEGKILILGSTKSYSNSKDIYLLKLSEDCSIGCNENILSPSVASISFTPNFPSLASQPIIPAIGNTTFSQSNIKAIESSLCYPPTPPLSKAIGGTGADISYAALKTSDGVIIAGSTQLSDTSGNAYILKLDSSFNIVWTKTFGTNGVQEEIRDMIIDNDGNIVVIGDYKPLNRDALIAKINPDGTTIWVKKIDRTTDAGRGIVQTDDGGYIALVRTTGASDDIMLVKIDTNGNLQWAKRIYGSASDQPSSIIRTSDGNYIITGITQSFRVNAGNDGFIAKVDSSGNLLWFKSVGGPYDDEAPSLVESEDGNFIFLGSSRSSFGSDDYNILVGKIDKNGYILWKKVIGWGYTTSSHEYGHSISKAPDGNYIIIGRTDSIPPNSDIIVIKIDTNGNILQMNLLGGAGNEPGGKGRIVFTDDGKTVIVASTDSFGNGGFDIYITELSENTCGLKPVQDITISFGGFDEFHMPNISDETANVTISDLTVSESPGGNIVEACLTSAQAPALNTYEYHETYEYYKQYEEKGVGCSSFNLSAIIVIISLLILKKRKTSKSSK